LGHFIYLVIYLVIRERIRASGGKKQICNESPSGPVWQTNYTYSLD